MENEKWRSWIKDEQTAFCKGCLYGTVLNYLSISFDELNIDPKNMVSVSGIGCAAWITDRYLKIDTLHTTHGRPIAYATGVKLANPDLDVIVVSGDGDLGTIGTNHLIHAIKRNIDITVFCVNNFVYGMTGGQFGGTTPINAITTTTPNGNEEEPLDLIKLVLACGCTNAVRHTVLTKHPRIVIKDIKQAMRHKGFSFVELIAPCITHFNRKNKILTPENLKKYLKNNFVSSKKITTQTNKNPCGKFSNLTEYIKHME